MILLGPLQDSESLKIESSAMKYSTDEKWGMKYYSQKNTLTIFNLWNKELGNVAVTYPGQKKNPLLGITFAL